MNQIIIDAGSVQSPTKVSPVHFRKLKKKTIDQLRPIRIRSRIKDDDDTTGSRDARGSETNDPSPANRFRR